MEHLLVFLTILLFIQHAFTNEDEGVTKEVNYTECIIKVNYNTKIPDDLQQILTDKTSSCTGKEIKIYFKVQNIKLKKELTIIDSLNEKVWDKIVSFSINYGDIKEIPEKLAKAKNIQDVNLSHNQITNIPDFSGSTKLKTLILSHNEINSSISLPKFKNLNVLNLTYNHISLLEKSNQSDVIQLQRLYLGHNDIKDIPVRYFEKCENLEELDLSYNFIHGQLNITQVHGLGNLKVLTLSNNLLESLGMASLKFEHLQKLFLQHNNISSLSNDDFTVMRQLKMLNLSENPVERFQDNTFKNLINLDKLYLSDTGMKNISKQMFQNNNKLTYLDVSHNNLNRIEPGSFKNNQITELKLNDNDPGLVQEPINKELFEGLKVSALDLSNLYITEIKPESFEFLHETLKYLNLSKNKIASIYEKPFVNLTFLETLDLSDNKISVLNEDAFEDLESLNDLNLSNNDIKKIESRLFLQLQQLRSFKCVHCNLQNIEEGTFNVTTLLEYLDLSENSLSDINVFENLNHLKTIILSENDFENIPIGMFPQMVNLKEIDLSSNKKIIINTHFENLKHLEYVNLKNTKECYFGNATDTSIKKLDLSSSGIENLPLIYVDNVKDLESLILKDNRISVLSADHFQRLKTLKMLDLSNNTIKNIPENSFKDFTQLNNLNLAKNEIADLEPSTFSDLHNLKYLDLSENTLNTLKDDIFAGTQLELLYLNSNNINRIFHKAFAGLNKLKVLDLGKNQLRFFGRWTVPHINTLEINLEDNLIDYNFFEEFTNSSVTFKVSGNPFPCTIILEAKVKYSDQIKTINEICVDKNEGKVSSITPKVNSLPEEMPVLTEPSVIIQSQSTLTKQLKENSNDTTMSDVTTSRSVATNSNFKSNTNITTSSSHNDDKILASLQELRQNFNKINIGTKKLEVILKEKKSENNYKSLMYFIAISLGIITIVVVVKILHNFWSKRQSLQLNQR